jgi:hypothetical protein
MDEAKDVLIKSLIAENLTIKDLLVAYIAPGILLTVEIYRKPLHTHWVSNLLTTQIMCSHSSR